MIESGTLKQIKLLPVNSFELEQQLAELGLSLLAFAKQYNFSEKYAGVKNCDFIQSIIIEFTAEIKVHFIAYYAVHIARNNGVQNATIIANDHGRDVIAEASIHAQQAGIKTTNFNAGLFFKIKYALIRIKKGLINAVYQKMVQRRLRKTWVGKIPEASTGQFKVLMSTYHPGTVSTLTPVQDRLMERTDVHQLYIANRYETYNKLIKLGYQNVISAWGVRPSEKIRVNPDVLRGFVNDFFERSFSFGKATPHFKSLFYAALRKKLQVAITLYSPLIKIFDEYRPDAVVLSSSSTIDAQLMVHIAALNNIKAIEITHGLFQETPILKFQNIPIKLVWNQFQADLMKTFKNEVDCILVGNPKHDLLLEKFRKNPPLNHYKKPYILFATTPGNNNNISATTYLRILIDFVMAAQQDYEMLYVIKLHPTENMAKVVADCNSIGAPKNLVVEQNKDVYELIYHAVIVMVVTSTVGYEALLFNKKIITYNVENSEKWLPFSKYKLAISVNSAEDILFAINELKNERIIDLASDKKSYFVYSDGNAINRTIDIILSSNDK